MKQTSQMGEEEFRQHIEGLAHESAAEWYRLQHPLATEQETRVFAGRHWQEHLAAALDLYWDSTEAAANN